MAYLVDGAVFVGDTLFMPDVGSGRTDFPGGDACQLYRSIRRLLALPPDTVMYVCHDYPPPHRAAALADDRGRAARRQRPCARRRLARTRSSAMRTARDATLAAPKLFLPSIRSTCCRSACRRPTRAACATCPCRCSRPAPRTSIAPRSDRDTQDPHEENHSAPGRRRRRRRGRGRHLRQRAVVRTTRSRRQLRPPGHRRRGGGRRPALRQLPALDRRCADLGRRGPA